MDKYLKWMTYIGVIFLFLIILNAFSYKEVYGGGLPTYESYSNYEVKYVSNTLYGIAGTDALNRWHWARYVKRVEIIRKSSHTLYCDFDVYVPTFSYVVPTSTDSYMIDGEISTYQLDNTFVIPIGCSDFSIYVASKNVNGTANLTTPNIRVIGIGD